MAVVLDSDSGEMGSLSEAAPSSNRGSFPDIISISSAEELPPARTLRPSTTVSLENYSSGVISVSSVEESNTSKPRRENIAYEINFNERNIEEICICCGSLEIHTQHPLFQGGMCAPCTEHLLERFFLCDNDGYKTDCAICYWSNSLIMCDDPTCNRCFCEECMDSLVCSGFSDKIKKKSPWICFLCAPQRAYGLLKRKRRWRAELKRFYDQESNHLWIYQPLQTWDKKPIRVLSLFDNITQELKSLGFLGESKGSGTLKYLDDVTDTTRIHIDEWGPFDFIFGSTPPIGNSYQQPSAWYFYQYFRILQYVTPPERMFFWMFVDNLVLEEEDRDTASRFFQMEAVLRYKQHDDTIQNAVHIWSNIPSVNSLCGSQDLLKLEGRVKKEEETQVA